MASNLGFIYYLQNPNTAEIFYVGATQCSLNNRLRTHYQHLREFERGIRKTNRRYEYLKALRPDKATIHLLEIITDIAILDEREGYFIKHFRELYPNLTNMTDGGKGGYTSEYYLDEELQSFCDKISKANKGRPKPIGFAENLSKKRIGLGNPAAKPIINNGIIGTKDRISFKWLKYGFEVNTYANNKYAYGNIYSKLKIKPNKNIRCLGYEFMWFDKAPKRIQDIVQAQCESIER